MGIRRVRLPLRSCRVAPREYKLTFRYRPLSRTTQIYAVCYVRVVEA
jgi:hypothetical protein